uniref:Uncharacterized protein n=1 Tax=uncultured bacterium Contigcl_47 TaxID=1393673 RepID=W0FLC2_9BACT|nr:hypothetical protein [uncultured bacterium Contigcl_47]
MEKPSLKNELPDPGDDGVGCFFEKRGLHAMICFDYSGYGWWKYYTTIAGKNILQVSHILLNWEVDRM